MHDPPWTGPGDLLRQDRLGPRSPSRSRAFTGHAGRAAGRHSRADDDFGCVRLDLPAGTRVLIRSAATGGSVEVRIDGRPGYVVVDVFADFPDGGLWEAVLLPQLCLAVDRASAARATATRTPELDLDVSGDGSMVRGSMVLAVTAGAPGSPGRVWREHFEIHAVAFRGLLVRVGAYSGRPFAGVPGEPLAALVEHLAATVAPVEVLGDPKPGTLLQPSLPKALR